MRSLYRQLLVLALALVCAAGTAHADRIEQLSRTLSNDRSWRVRLQAAVVLGKLKSRRAEPALARALGDPNETVRGVAAQVLGELGDRRAVSALQHAEQDPSAFVRERAIAALGRLRPPPPAHTWPSSSAPLHVEVGGVGSKARGAPPDLARHLREYITRELEHTPGVTLAGPAHASGYLIDSAITSLQRRTTNQWVEVSCEVSYVVGRLPSRAMVMMTSGGATVQAPRGGSLRPEALKSLELDALENAVHGAHENLVAFFRSQQ